MTKRQEAQRIERTLRLRGVYKPYVSIEKDRISIESYPLTAYITDGFDRETGPLHHVKLTDCSLPRIGQDATLTTASVLFGQDAMSVISSLLKDFHGPAYARAKEQDKAAEQDHTQ